MYLTHWFDRRNSITVALFNYSILFQLENEQSFRATAVKLHENFSIHTLDNDIALIQVEGSIQFSKFVEPICMPYQGYEFDTNLKCYAAGWGHTKYQGEPSLELRQVEVSCLICTLSILNNIYPLMKAAVLGLRVKKQKNRI